MRHEDVKSRNILIKDSNASYADFSSSKIFESELTSSTTSTVTSSNTPMYSAPEVISTKKRSRSADVFSLGWVFTKMFIVEGDRTVANYFGKELSRITGITLTRLVLIIRRWIRWMRVDLQRE